MKIRTVLVTGASGKVGRSLVPALLKAGYEVRATQFKTPVKTPDVPTVTGSMTDPRFVRRALKGVEVVEEPVGLGPWVPVGPKAVREPSGSVSNRLVDLGADAIVAALVFELALGQSGQVKIDHGFSQ